MNKKTIHVLLRFVVSGVATVVGVVWGRHHRYELAWIFLVFSIAMTAYFGWIAFKAWPSQAERSQNRSDAYGTVFIFLILALLGIYLACLSYGLVVMEAAR